MTGSGRLCGLCLVAAVGGCGPDEVLPDPPAIVELSITENPNCVLSATLEVETDRDTTAVVEIDGGSHGIWTVPYDTAEGARHVVPILGLRAENHYDITVVVTADGPSSDDTASFDSGPLPDDLPPLDVTVHDPGRVSPGVTVFPVGRWNPSNDGQWGYLIGLDEQGKVVWYYDARAPLEDTRLLSNRRIAALSANQTVLEIDAMGAGGAAWTAPEVGIDSVHHELFEIADGNIALLSTELRSITGYGDGTETHDVVGDVIVELDPNRDIVRSISLLDLLDPLRVRDGFDAPFWNSTYPGSAGTKDWSHGNAVIHDPRDDSFIVSARHQDWLVKIDHQTGALIWRMGEDGDFTMQGGGEFQFHQHAPEIQPSGSLLVYDNGNARTSLGANDTPFTRVMELDIDETSMQVSVLWEFRNAPAYFAPFVGDADRLPNGNILITDGGIVADPALAIGDPANQKSARILEVTHDEPPLKVWEVVIFDASAGDPVGYHVYRSSRLSSLYDAID